MTRNFYWLVLARFFFVFGVEVQAILMGWQMYDLTHDPLKLGLIGLAEALPALSLSLFAGFLVDRFNPFRFYQCVIVVSFVSMVMAWHATDPNMLYIAAIITGFARAFTSPSLNSFIPKIVPREELRRTSAYTSTAYKSATVVGPGIAGALLGISGFKWPYIMAIASLVFGSFALLMIRYRHIPRAEVKAIAESDAHTPAQKNPSITSELLIGVRYVFRHPLLLSAMSLDMFAVLFGGVTALLPVFAAEILKVGPAGLGWLRAAPAFGAILMGFYLIKRPIQEGAGKKLLVSVLGFGLCILIFAFSRNYWLSIAVLAVSGGLDAVSMVVRGAIVQLCSPEDMRGRIAAVNSIFIGSSNEIGEFESGVSASLMGTIPSVVFGGCMTLITVCVVFWKAKDLRDLDLRKL